MDPRLRGDDNEEIRLEYGTYNDVRRKYMKKNRFFTSEKITTTLLFISAVIAGIGISFSSSINPFLSLALAAIVVALPFFLVLLKDTSYGILLVTFLLPFEQIGGFQIAGSNVRISQLVFIATFAAWILRGLYLKNLYIKIDKKLALIFIFITLSVLSLQNSVNLFRSYQILAFIIFTFVVYIFFSSIKLTETLLKKIIFTLFISMTLTSLFGLFQFVGDMIGLPTSITGLEEIYTKAVFGFPRIQSTANEPLNYANYLLLPLSIAFALYFNSAMIQKKKKLTDLKNFSLWVLILGNIVMILTFSRGGWGGIALSFTLLGLTYLRQLVTPKNILIGIVALVLIVVGIDGIARATNAPFTLEALVERINVSDFSAEHRRQTTNEGLEGWKEHKFLGIGIGAYGPFVAKYHNVEPKGGWQTLNNEYAELLVETGILGLTSIVLLWGSLLLCGLRNFKHLPSFNSTVLIGLTAAFAGMLLQYISFSTLYVFHIWYLAGLINNNYFSINKSAKEAQ